MKTVDAEVEGFLLLSSDSRGMEEIYLLLRECTTAWVGGVVWGL